MHIIMDSLRAHAYTNQVIARPLAAWKPRDGGDANPRPTPDKSFYGPW